MKMEQMHGIASPHSINPGEFLRGGRFKPFQVNKGNFDCFATAYDGECGQTGCIWREDCFEAAQRGEPS